MHELAFVRLSGPLGTTTALKTVLALLLPTRAPRCLPVPKPARALGVAGPVEARVSDPVGTVSGFHFHVCLLFLGSLSLPRGASSRAPAGLHFGHN